MKSINRRQFVYGTGAVLGSTMFGCGRPDGPTAGADTTVFVNGTVLPVDAAFSGHEALAISGNRILAVGGRDEVLAAAGRGAKTVDLAGRVVLPGFIEPHMHFALMAGLGFIEDVGPFRFPTFDDALDALVEGFVGRKAQLVSQVGLAEKDEGDQRSRIHLVVEQHAGTFGNEAGTERVVDRKRGRNLVSLLIEYGEVRGVITLIDQLSFVLCD